ncbi:hypothetical protein I862_06900 [endosymbiont of Acanthamoeba sp. UWC8]|uniref:hypothetical protein n=1 Tax=endosymbiont of Acanthamoeba sp. UWC8 TaxID=86106 RepID=UPI0004D1B9EC|nr:hypothetical protein [endosymbiont of Acanthamoeba sp. UWC8]AIF81934.1 hypothetical protein I862_06900 [endosymbiont of Acanthamoeba sp. UWC8]
MTIKCEKFLATVDNIKVGNQIYSAYQLAKLMLSLPIEMFTDSFVYSGVGLVNTMLCGGIRLGKDYLYNGYEDKDKENQFETLTSNFTRLSKSLPAYIEQEYEQFSIKYFLSDHMEELKTGALVHLALENLASKNIYNKIAGFDDKFKFIDIDIPKDTFLHNFHMTYDYSHKGAHFEHSVINPPLCVLYENRPLVECLSIYIKEPVEHALFAIEVYKYMFIEIPHDTVTAICEYTEIFDYMQDKHDEL